MSWSSGMPADPPDTELRVLCPFCDAPWTASMMDDLYYTQGCDTCGHGGGVYGEIRVTCDNCERVVYRKEIDQR